MLLGLREGRVEFRFDVGSGPAIIRSDPVELRKWHTVRIKRQRKDGKYQSFFFFFFFFFFFIDLEGYFHFYISLILEERILLVVL